MVTQTENWCSLLSLIIIISKETRFFEGIDAPTLPRSDISLDKIDENERQSNVHRYFNLLTIFFQTHYLSLTRERMI